MEPWDDVKEAIDAAKSGADDLALALNRVIKNESWREFRQPTYGSVTHGSLREFIEAKPNAGLGLTVSAAKMLLSESNYTAIAADLQQILDREIPALAGHGEVGRGRDRLSDTKSKSEESGRDYILARLKRDYPAMAERVIAGEISANAAAVEVGIRQRYIRVRGDDIGLAVKKLIEEFGEEEVMDAIANQGVVEDDR